MRSRQTAVSIAAPERTEVETAAPHKKKAVKIYEAEQVEYGEGAVVKVRLMV